MTMTRVKTMTEKDLSSVCPPTERNPPTQRFSLLLPSAWIHRKTTGTIRPWLPWPMSEGRQQLLQQREIEPPTISGERIFPSSSGESSAERSGIDYHNNRSPSGVLVEAYERALPKRGGLVPEHVLREFCQFLVSFPKF